MDISPRLAAFRHVFDLQLRWSDIDQLGHVNNARYLSFFEEARIRYGIESGMSWNWTTEGMVIASVQVSFRRELKLYDEPRIYSRTTRVGKSSYDMEYLVIDKHGNLVCESTAVLVALNLLERKTIVIPERIRTAIATYETLPVEGLA